MFFYDEVAFAAGFRCGDPAVGDVVPTNPDTVGRRWKTGRFPSSFERPTGWVGTLTQRRVRLHPWWIGIDDDAFRAR